ncbi:MAG TPA: LysR substrate-binding domain-containing protein [Actinomycetota bacterium]|nr:LysR substrate-binding domain-containing protein [Actinomycetota bacterium]
MLDVRRLEVLNAVVDAGSVTKAAADLGYTPSAISQSLAALERETKTPLFERIGRGLRPTEAGLLLAEHARTVIAQLKHAEAALEALRSGRAGRLRVAAFATAGASLVPRALARFKERYPGVDVDLVMAETDDALAALHAGHIDIAVVARHRRIDDIDRALAFRHLLEDPYRVVLPRAHPAAARNAVSLEALSDTPWISTASARCNTLETVVTACARAGFTPRFAVEGDEFATTIGLVAAGLGVAMVPLLALSSVPKAVRVCRIRGGEPTRYVESVVRARSARAGVLDAMHEALRLSADSYPRAA